MINYKLYKLKNGLRIITAPLENTKAATILIGVNAGTRFEKKEEMGISHFLEHMVFKGTRKRPNTLAISSELDSFGADFNAFTGIEETSFFISCAGEELSRAAEILLDMLFHSLFLPKEIKREKRVVSEERKMWLDVSQRYVLELAQQQLYPNQPLGFSIIGEEATIKNFSAEKIRAYQKKFYQLNNIVVTFAGEIRDEKAILRQIEEGLEFLAPGKFNQPMPAREIQVAPNLKLRTKKTDQQAHCALSFRAFSRFDSRRPILKVLTNLLGGMMSSRLWIKVRERKGLGYYVSSEMWDFQDAGGLLIHFSVDVSRAEEAVKTVLEECRLLKTKLIKPTELNRSKSNLTGGLYLALETSHDIAGFLADQELFWQNIEQPEKIVAQHQKVTAEEIRDLARFIFQKQKLNLSLIAPFEDPKPFAKTLEQFE